MKSIFLTALVAALLSVTSTSAQADVIAGATLDSGDKMYFTDEPCSDPKVMQKLAEAARYAPELKQRDWKGGHMTWQGKPLAFCSTQVVGGYFIVDETGDSGGIPDSMVSKRVAI